jgi:hypothetical protein
MHRRAVGSLVGRSRDSRERRAGKDAEEDDGQSHEWGQAPAVKSQERASEFCCGPHHSG